jgi:hypothetical protein
LVQEKYRGETACDKRYDDDNNKLITHKHFIPEFKLMIHTTALSLHIHPRLTDVSAAYIGSLTLHVVYSIQTTTTKLHFVFPPFAGAPEFPCASHTKIWGTEVWSFEQIQLWATTTYPLTRESVINIRFKRTATKIHARCRVAKTYRGAAVSSAACQYTLLKIQ